MNRIQIFIKACQTNNPQLLLDDFSPQELRILEGIDFGVIYSLPSAIKNECKYCKKSDVNDITYGYWHPYWSPVHKKL